MSKTKLWQYQMLSAFGVAVLLVGCGRQPAEHSTDNSPAAPSVAKGSNATAAKPEMVKGEKAKRESAGSVLKTASGLEMVLIPAGQFRMGSDEGGIDVKPAHPVRLDGFYMDRTEVTQEVYQQLMGTNPSRRKGPTRPVEQVTWVAAVRFCNARSRAEGLTPCYDTNTWTCRFDANGYRLPTEAEWEYACRAGSTAPYPFGPRAEELKSYAWFEDDSDASTHAVRQKKPNAWGLYDMAGNVWEWCNDFYGVKYYRSSPVENPRGPDSGEKRVLRGGAWSTGAENCTSFVRNCDESGATDVCLTMDSNGFRCVRRK